MISTAANEFLESLERSRLLAGEPLEQVKTFARKKPIDAQRLAQILVEQNGLTSWQARRLLVGNRAFFLGSYKFLCPVGEGAHGVVFRALHTVMKRTVAVKILSRARLTHRNAKARFRREVQAMAQLNHPNIVTAFDAGQVGETLYLVMEYVQGLDLRTWSEYHNQLDVDWACDFIRQTALGLQHAHDQGMVHRDVKPANILVTWDASRRRPVAKLLDLGLARLLDQDDDEAPSDSAGPAVPSDSTDAELTQVGAVVGTPDYLAPEQILRDSPINERSDVYGLGCTLFKLLTGRVPFEGESIKEKILARLPEDASPPSLRRLAPGVDARLESIVFRMLKRDPPERFASAAEVAQALGPYTRRFARPWDEVKPHTFSAPQSPPSGSYDFSSDERLADFLKEMGEDTHESIDLNEELAAFPIAVPERPRQEDAPVPAALVKLPPLHPVPKTLSHPTEISGAMLVPARRTGITIPVWGVIAAAAAIVALLGFSVWAILK